MARTMFCAFVILLGGCSSSWIEIDDDKLVRSGLDLGEKSAELIFTDADADDSVIAGRVGALSPVLLTIVEQHRRHHGLTEWNAAQDAEGETSIAWNGKRLQGMLVDGVVYELDLRVRDQFDDPELPDGQGPVVDQSLTLSYSIEELEEPVDILVRYVDLSFTGDGCSAGGGIELTYPDGDDSYTVRIGFHGCGRVSVYDM